MPGMRHAPHNREPVKVAVCETWEEFEAAGPGAVFISPEVVPFIAEKGVTLLHNKCPGCGDYGGMATFPDGKPKPASPSWKMTGWPDAITLDPSVNCTGCCGWHGWLKQGTFAL